MISGFKSKNNSSIFLYSIYHSTVSRPAGYVFYILYLNFIGVTVSLPSFDLVKSWGGVTVTRGVSSAGLVGGGGGAPYRSVFMLALAPLVTVCRITACVQMAGKPAG